LERRTSSGAMKRLLEVEAIMQQLGEDDRVDEARKAGYKHGYKEGRKSLGAPELSDS
jgi:hypothetical protein